ncbi:hypothetical protein ACFYN9_17885 [Streptomyces collinus]|uniref:Uncharacterized protein n=2 Tax=Streptomyces TaxID=1883 RepID=A0AA89QC76_STRCU|nr:MULTISPECIES: hypothetical protein [Streptomyces]MBB5813380.1 hypothetical protein [Streptomyces collinus]MEC7056259.1 hypothetical protein [Streptomyces violaceochromogenes]WMX66473.1 hypothetical protein RFN52_25195 [Streptomyces collinus]GHC68044.1 hypothetical protein GCM10010309_33670 [Streptomyces violaceochromogenes]
MSLVELIAQADERGLAASGLACLDRCVPLLGGDDETLRPVWASLGDDAGAGEWGERLEQARGKLDAAGAGDEAAVLAHRMLEAAPAERSAAEVRVWADACSVASLQIHRLLDTAQDEASTVDSRREGRTDGMSPLVAAELRRQVIVLEVLAGHGPAGLRRALEVSTEGRRVLRAVVSRRSRQQG